MHFTLFNLSTWSFILFYFITLPIDGAKILCLLPCGGFSTTHVFNPLVEKLASNGHQVTAIWSLPQKPHKSSNIVDIVIKQPALTNTSTMTEIYDSVNTSPLLFFASFKNFISEPCENYFQHPNVQELLKSGKEFDVVIVSGFMNECALTTASLLGQAIIFFSPNTIFSWTPIFVPRLASYVPNIMLPYTEDMNFLQRMHNAFYVITLQLVHDYYLMPIIDVIVAKHLPQAPSVSEALRKIDFVLTNADPVIITPRPIMPNIVNVGGLHCVKPKPLTKDLEDFIQGAGKNGFILFSLGSNAQSQFLPNATRNAFISALSRLKQRIIWKYEDDLESLPANIKIVKWIPQQDLLGHPQIRLFITHGGLLSLQQAVYHAVPVIGIPLFSDQPGNMARIESLMIGRELKFNDISKKNVYEIIKSILNDKRYITNVQHYSSIFRDQPQHPLDTATFWVEYVIRHKGAPHLGSHGRQLNCLQYFSLDVIAAVMVISSFNLWIGITMAKFVINVIWSRKKSKKVE